MINKAEYEAIKKEFSTHLAGSCLEKIDKVFELAEFTLDHHNHEWETMILKGQPGSEPAVSLERMKNVLDHYGEIGWELKAILREDNSQFGGLLHLIVQRPKRTVEATAATSNGPITTLQKIAQLERQVSMVRNHISKLRGEIPVGSACKVEPEWVGRWVQDLVVKCKAEGILTQ